MDADLYDEFGNYVGPDLPADDDQGNDFDEREEVEEPEPDWDGGEVPEGKGTDIIEHGSANATGAESAIVLHEDKKYYPEASEVYPEAETMVQDEDTQPLSQPIIAPIKKKLFSSLEKQTPETTYTSEFLTSLMRMPALIRNVAVVGHLAHGKTSLVDSAIAATHGWGAGWDPHPDETRRYTDARADEQARGCSVKSTPVSLVLQNSDNKSYLINIIDTPGHVNFSDEVTASLRAADGVVLVVDAVEGVMLNTERLIRHAVAAGLPLVLVINKVDRLILELKLPPNDAYFKLLHTVQEVNAQIEAAAASLPAGGAGGTARRQPPLNPALGNVAFACGLHGWSFTLESFARTSAAAWAAAPPQPPEDGTPAPPPPQPVDPAELAKRLWGDVYFDRATRRFKRSLAGGSRAFCEFVLEPLYKVYSAALSEDADGLAATLATLGVYLRKSELHADPKPLLRLIFRQFLGGPPAGLVDMLVRHVPSPLEGARAKVAATYTGSLESAEGRAMQACDPAGPLMINVVKLYATPDAAAFLAFGRVLSGTVSAGQSVRVLGEHYSLDDDEEDAAVRAVTGICVGQARYTLAITSATPGNLVMLEGVDDVIAKTATITGVDEAAAEAAPFRPLAFNTLACVNVSVEPLNPSELPKVLAGLRKIAKSYPLAATRVEESGEHVIVGTGELGLDCIMHDLREMFAGVEVKVADPVVSFQETVADTSSIKCFAETPNERNKLTMVAEPLDRGLAEDIEAGAIDITTWDRKRVADFFQTKYSWDVLAARNVWAFGPTPRGPNVLLDDTLASEVDKGLLKAVRDPVVQGFQWGCREGPLCDEPMRNVKFKILDATVASEPIARGGGQVIPTARRVAYSAFLLASPRLMEPVYHVEVLTPPDAVTAVYAVFARRRGHVTQDAPKPGTPFYVVKGFLPVIESFGFETDLRVHTQGQAFGLQVFDHWAVVPGDPMDKSIVLRPLEPSPPPHLAREFMVKTRRRKGLAEDVSVHKYFDAAMLRKLAEQAQAAAAAAAGGY